MAARPADREACAAPEIREPNSERITVTVDESALGRGDELRFLRTWLLAPLTTGAQMPSGRRLARAMAAAVDPEVPGWVIELGPGTGPVTRALIERGVAPERLLLVEANAEFCRLLRERCPGARVLHADAFAAMRRLRREGLPVSAVVSSLPLMTLAPRRRLRLLHDCLRLMGPGGRFVQFTYAFRSPLPLRATGIRAAAAPRVWWNLWPAKVWTYQRADGPGSTYSSTAK
ncbi:MAG: methyltransferase domain-containing protein [Nevskia sp.]|nr:methyltransferase domain-containing protein [Nevskia sp.]